MTATIEKPVDQDLALQGALTCVRKGFSVFPVKIKSKFPTGRWKNTSTTDEDQVRSWLDGTGLNFGINAEASGLVIIDEDTLGDLERWADDHDVTLPATLTVTTGREGGGRHFYFRRDGVDYGNRTPFKADGYDVDVRGKGYVVGPGSLHGSGARYTVVDPTAPAEVPAPLREYLLAQPSQRPTHQQIVPTATGTDSYVRGGIEKVLRALQGLQNVPVGSVPHWEPSVFAEACSLVELSNTSGGSYDLEQAHHDFLEAAPTDRSFGLRQLEHKWDDALRKVGGNVRERPTHKGLSEEFGIPRRAPGPIVAQQTQRSRALADEDLEELEEMMQQDQQQEEQEQQASPPLLRVGSLVNPAHVKIERPTWIKRDWYPTKVATMISGKGGSGKSSLTLADIAAGSRCELHGRCWQQPVRSIIVSVEDSQGMQRARLQAAGADLEQVRFFTITDAETTDEVIPAIPGDLPELARLAREFHADLIVIDPLSSVVRGNLDKSDVIRAAMDPLTKIARELDVAIVVVHHHRKGGGSSTDLAANSHAIRDVVRSSLLVAYDKENDERVITFDKSNYSTLEGSSLAFELQSVLMADENGKPLLDEEGKEETVPVAVITGEASTSVEEIANRAPAGAGNAEDRNAAQEFLVSHLQEKNMEAPAGDVLKAGRAAGFNDQELKDARRRCRDPKIRSRKSSFGNGWVWAIDAEGGTSGSQGGEGGTVSDTATFATLGRSSATLGAGQGGDPA